MEDSSIQNNQPVILEQLNFGGLFKLLFFAGILSWGLVAVLFLVLALLSPHAVKINGHPADNTLQALAAIPLVLILGAILSSLGAALGAALLKAFGRFIPMGRLN